MANRTGNSHSLFGDCVFLASVGQNTRTSWKRSSCTSALRRVLPEIKRETEPERLQGRVERSYGCSVVKKHQH